MYMICNQILENVNIFQEDGLGKRNLLHFLTHNLSICSELGVRMNSLRKYRDSKFSLYGQIRGLSGKSACIQQ